MTGLEFKSKVVLLGLKNQEQVADALGVTIRTVSTIYNSDKVKKIYELALLGYEAKQENN